jgi:peptidoglycan/LPS O-acetylase OafA/YrhL
MTSIQPKNSQNQSGRLYFLDWVRIIAFFVLIFYHVGMYYVTWDFHVKSPVASNAIEPLMMLSSPWRLSLLFLISGVASRFMLNKLSTLNFFKQRSKRLLIPLLFGMLVVVPPQSYFEVVEKVAYSGSYLDFMGLYLTAYHGFCRDHNCLIMPTWNHLWFVAYLWVYTLILAGLALLPHDAVARFAQMLTRLLQGWRLIALPTIMLAIIRITMVAHFPTTHALIDDWFSHANYLSLFLLGALFAPQVEFWRQMDDMRWVALGLGLSCWALLIIYFAWPDAGVPAAQLEYWRLVQRTVYACCEWSAIVAACGFAHRHLQFDSARRRYLTQAVFPLYLVHQTVIIVVAHAIKPAGIAAPIEAMILIVLTFGSGFAVFEIVRRISLLRPLFGVGHIEGADARATESIRPQFVKAA